MTLFQCKWLQKSDEIKSRDRGTYINICQVADDPCRAEQDVRVTPRVAITQHRASNALTCRGLPAAHAHAHGDTRLQGCRSYDLLPCYARKQSRNWLQRLLESMHQVHMYYT